MEKLGIELPLLITQIVNFAIMVFVLTKLLYKPILKGLQERRRKIEEGLALTQKLQIEEEKLNQRKQEMLTETREETKALIEQAKIDGKRMQEELILEGKKEAEQLKLKMERELKQKYDEMAEKVAGKTVEIASEMVKRVLPSILDNEAQHKLVIKQLQLLEKQHAKQ